MTIRPKLTTGHLSTLFHLGAIGDLSDRQLLERFATGQGEPADLAFNAILERHGPMVLRVCNALLRDPHDAQDAFQATFLVLLRKSRELWVHDSLGPWLHRVARRTAARAQAIARRRRECERKAAVSRTAPHDRAGHDPPSSVLHDEIDRLPERLRVLVVLCHLEGQSQELAARTLSPARGNRQEPACIVPATGSASASPGAASAAPPDYSLLTPRHAPADSIHSLPLYASILRAAAQAGLSQAARDTLVSARAIHLFEETIKTMFLTRMRIGVALVLLAGCIAWGRSASSPSKTPAGPARGPRRTRTPTAEATGNTPSRPPWCPRVRSSLPHHDRRAARARAQSHRRPTGSNVTARTRSADERCRRTPSFAKPSPSSPASWTASTPYWSTPSMSFPRSSTSQRHRRPHPAAEPKDTVAPIPASRATKPAEPAAAPPL